jgi:hypothetical protein
MAQRELMIKFHAIELNNGFRVESTVPVDLDNPHDQLRLKEFAWRISEEIGETVLALGQHGKSSIQYREEISDVLHFYVELCLIAGITPSQIEPMGPDRLIRVFQMVRNELPENTSLLAGIDLHASWLYVIVSLSQAMNGLKNRPWKQTLQPTNRTAFREHMVNTLRELATCCVLSGMNADDLFHEYFKKHNANQLRQASGV